MLPMSGARIPVIPLITVMGLSCADAAFTSVELLSTSAEDLKKVFFSGEPWLIQCASKSTLRLAADDPTDALHEVVRFALTALPSECRVGLLDCRERLPSGKTTLERFKLDGSLMPTLMVVANAMQPKQITSEALAKYGSNIAVFPSRKQQAAALAAFVTKAVEPRITTLSSTEQLHKHCLRRRHCAIVLSERSELGSGSARVLQRIMREFRSVSFATVNTARYDLSLARRLPEVPGFEVGSPRLLTLLSTPVKGQPKKLTLKAKSHRDAFALEPLRKFLTSYLDGQLDMTPLQKAPTLQWRRQDDAKRTEQDSSGGGASRSGRKGLKTSVSEDASKGSKRGSSDLSNRRASSSGASKPKRSADTDARGRRAAAESSDSTEQKRISESERRRRMAEEEEAYLRSMFDGGGGDDETGVHGDALWEAVDDDEENVLDFDEEDEDMDLVEERPSYDRDDGSEDSDTDLESDEDDEGERMRTMARLRVGADGTQSDDSI